MSAAAMSSLSVRPSASRPCMSSRRPAARRVVRVNALSDTNTIIAGATFASLALGRFVFLPFQRDNVARQGLPKQNGVSNIEAGDKFAEEASFALKTKDPAGFNLIDVFAWGAIGHAFGYLILATSSLNAAGLNPKPF